MIIYLRSGGKLRERLKPDIDLYTRRVEVDGNPTIREILVELDIPEGLVAFAFAGGKFQRLDYEPGEDEIVTLQPPVSGG